MNGRDVGEIAIQALELGEPGFRSTLQEERCDGVSDDISWKKNASARD
jgi:hypothetical protein